MGCICPYISSVYTPDDGSSDPKYVMWFGQNIDVLTEHLLFYLLGTAYRDMGFSMIS